MLILKPQVLPGTTVAVTAEHAQTMEMGQDLSALRMAPQGEELFFLGASVAKGLEFFAQKKSGKFIAASPRFIREAK